MRDTITAGDRRLGLGGYLKDMMAQAFSVLLGPAAATRGTNSRMPMGRVRARAIVTGSRSKYTPAGPQRNCGYRGISPKSYTGALDATT